MKMEDSKQNSIKQLRVRYVEASFYRHELTHVKVFIHLCNLILSLICCLSG